MFMKKSLILSMKICPNISSKPLPCRDCSLSRTLRLLPTRDFLQRRRLPISLRRHLRMLRLFAQGRNSETKCMFNFFWKVQSAFHFLYHTIMEALVACPFISRMLLSDSVSLLPTLHHHSAFPE